MTNNIGALTHKPSRLLTTPTPHQSNIEALLPKEVFHLIGSYLDPKELQVIALTNRNISKMTSEGANYYEPVAIELFIGNLIKDLDQELYKKQIGLLTKISQEIKPQNCRNLKALKPYILKEKESLIDVIKTLEKERIDALGTKLQLPNFFEGIFEVAKLEKKLDEARLETNEFSKSIAIMEISKALVEAGQVNRALEVAQLITDEKLQGLALQTISQALAEGKSNFKTAAEQKEYLFAVWTSWFLNKESRFDLD